MKQQHGGLKITKKLGLWPNIGKRELNECLKAGMDTANKADRLQEEGLFNVDAVIHFLLIYDELATVFIEPYHESNLTFCTSSIKVILNWSMQHIFPFQCG